MLQRFLLAISFLLAAGNTYAFQAALVTLCSDADQPGAGVNLRTALSMGAKISFQCGTVTIPVRSTLNIARSTEIDGGGTVTLDSNLSARMFRVSAPNTIFHLSSIGLKRGRPDHVIAGPDYTHVAGTAGGIVLSQAPGTRLELVGCTVQDSDYPMELVDGMIWVRDTTFQSNRTKVLMAPNLEHRQRSLPAKRPKRYRSGVSAAADDHRPERSQWERRQCVPWLQSSGHAKHLHRQPHGDPWGSAIHWLRRIFYRVQPVRQQHRRKRRRDFRHLGRVIAGAKIVQVYGKYCARRRRRGCIRGQQHRRSKFGAALRDVRR